MTKYLRKKLKGMTREEGYAFIDKVHRISLNRYIFLVSLQQSKDIGSFTKWMLDKFLGWIEKKIEKNDMQLFIITTTIKAKIKADTYDNHVWELTKQLMGPEMTTIYDNVINAITDEYFT